MLKILMICNTDGALYVFRKPLIKRLIHEKHLVSSITSDSKYIDKLTDLGVKSVVLEFARHSASVFANIRIIFRLKRLIASEMPDIVHSFTHKPAIYGTITAKLSGVKKIFVTITGLGMLFVYNDLRTKVLRLLLLFQYKIALKFTAKVFFQNADDMDYFLKRKIINKEKAILTNGSGIDLKEFDLPDEARRRKNRMMISDESGVDLHKKKIILFPARALKEKGFFEFYGAAKIINALSGRFLFIHLGLIDRYSKHKISWQNIHKFARDCGVHYLGFKENIIDYIIGSDAVVLPSYREGMARSLIEALAFGKSIVTTDVPGCKETVVDGWNGYLCSPADKHSLAAKIMALDEDVLKKSRLRSRSVCETKFDAEKLIKITLEQYFS
jgi:N,N'-diacetylbacillosaminyl-diphospho-undecaprenol alpha-1,3-N-acetylgalactosaminyltransferase